MQVTSDYIAVVREPRYAEAPEYQNPDTRLQYMKEHGIRMLRKYQVNALKTVIKGSCLKWRLEPVRLSHLPQ